MNVLMITGDVEVLRDGSARQSELKEEAEITRRLMVVVMNTRHRRSGARKVDNTLWLFPTNAWLSILNIFSALKMVRREIFFRNRLQADLIVANDPLMSAFVGIIVARTYKRPLHIYVPQNIFSHYYVWHSPKSIFISVIARIFIGLADSVSVSSEPIRAALIRRDPVFADRTTTIARYVDVGAVQAEQVGDDLHLKYTQFRALLLVVAPLVREHNIKLVIDVVAELSKYHEYIGAVIVGDGPQKWSLRRYAASKGVKGKIMFEPPRDDLTSYYKSCFALIVPSHIDEFESTIEDAAAAGCVVISSPVGNATKIITHKDNGYLCDPNAMLGYADAVTMLLNNDKLRSAMREKAAEAAKKFNSVDKEAHLTTRKKAWESAITSARGY